MAAKLIALVLPLGLDTFAVAAALGMLGTSPATRLRVSIVFPAFEAAMPLIGLALGAPLGHAIGDSADYIAIGVLLAFGLYTLLGSEEREERAVARLAAAHGPGVLLLGLSISLDELAIGFTLGLLRLPAALVIALIAVQALILTPNRTPARQPPQQSTARRRRTSGWPNAHHARDRAARREPALLIRASETLTRASPITAA